MWTILAVSASVVALLLMAYQLRRIVDLPTRCMLIALWLRYALQAVPEITVDQEIAGLSIIALASIATIGILSAFLDPRLLRLRYLLPFYVVFSIIVVSSLVNGQLGGLARDALKWLYFLEIATLCYRAILIYGTETVMRALLPIFFTPLSLQAASILLDNKKMNEMDMSLSYIGGYSHEAVFSIIVFSFIVTVSVIRWQRTWIGAALLFAGMYSLFMANYRTTLIAAIPIVLVAVVSGLARAWQPRLRPSIRLTAALCTVLAGALLWHEMPDRYADVVNLTRQVELLTQPPAVFGGREQQYFSGRLFLWSEYIEAYRHAGAVEWLIGFGANAYEGRMRLYAHNTFISYLYEFGAFGLIALVCLVMGNLFLALRVLDPLMKWRLLSAHIGFFILNISTMPLWSNEGMSLYAILLGLTWSRQPVAERGPYGGVALSRVV